MSEWILIDADLGTYSSTKFKSGGRLYFIKEGIQTKNKTRKRYIRYTKNKK